MAEFDFRLKCFVLLSLNLRGTACAAGRFFASDTLEIERLFLTGVVRLRYFA